MSRKGAYKIPWLWVAVASFVLLICVVAWRLYQGPVSLGVAQEPLAYWAWGVLCGLCFRGRK